MVRRAVNPYYIHLAGYDADKILCFLGNFLAQSVKSASTLTGTQRLFGKDCGDECIEITSITRSVLDNCGIGSSNVEARNLLHTFYNALRFLGILVPPNENMTQRELCEWLERPWDKSLKARLSDVAWSLVMMYATCRRVLEKLASSIEQNAYSLLGSLLLLNVLVWYTGRKIPKPPAVLVALGLLAGKCDGRCVETLYNYLSSKRIVEKRENVKRKLKSMCEILQRALKILDSLASHSFTIPYYCVQPFVIIEPQVLKENVLRLAREHGEHACIEAIRICA